MRKITIYLSFLLILFSPLSSQGATKSVTATWAMTDTTNVTGYKMYLSYDSMMTNEFFACETNNGVATTLTCSNVDLTQSPVYIKIAALTTDGEINSAPSVQTFDGPVTTPAPDGTSVQVVQGFAFTTITPADTSNPTYKINFQPPDVSIPTDYQVDSGETFNVADGYGWVTGPSSMGTRDRDNSASPDQAYDTMIHVKPTSIWELAVPNGNYSITICVGDSNYPSGNQNLQVEGQTLIDNAELSSFPQWYEETTTVSVEDNKLSITFTGSTDPARLCWLNVTPIN